MKHLSKSQLQEITTLYLVANTPKSLLYTLLKSSVVDTLRSDCSCEELLTYYNNITSKAKRSPFIIALAYATLVALLVKSPPTERYPDTSYLEWGQILESHLSQHFGTTSTVILSPNTSKPTMQLVSSSGIPITSFDLKEKGKTNHIIS